MSENKKILVCCVAALLVGTLADVVLHNQIGAYAYKQLGGMAGFIDLFFGAAAGFLLYKILER